MWMQCASYSARINFDIFNVRDILMLIISNVYIPPASSCSNGYHSSIERLLTTPDTLILGDFNAHHPSWYSRSTDTRGTKMADSINGSDYGILNWDSPTRVPANAELSSPDFSLASASLISSCSGRHCQHLAQTIYQSSLDYR